MTCSAAKVEFASELSMEQLTAAINDAEAAVRRGADGPPRVHRARHLPPRRPREAGAIGILLVLAAVLTFSSSSSIVKWADTPGSVLAFWRMIGAIVLWWVVVGGRRVLDGTAPAECATWRAVLPAGCSGFNIALMFTAITMTSIAHAEFITALSPLFLVPAGAILFGEQPNPRALAWGALSIVGLAIVLFLGGNQGGATVGGDALVLVVVVTWSATCSPRDGHEPPSSWSTS